MSHSTKLSLTAILFAIITLEACRCDWEWVKGKGDNITQTRSIPSFNSVSLEMDAHVEFSNGSGGSIEINAQQNIADIIETSVQGSRLVIRYKDHVNVRSHNPVTIKVSATVLNDIAINGSGNISTNSILNGSGLAASVNGSGDINISAATVNSLDLRINGSGTINISSGFTNAENVKINGSGDINSLGLEAQDVNADISGSGTAKVHAAKTLNAHISGSGKVYYRGNPVVSSHISGSGSVKPI